MRTVPDPLYSRLSRILKRIADPSFRDPETGPMPTDELRMLYEDLEARSAPDPWVTELAADFERDPRKAIALYEKAIAQARDVLLEPTYSLRVDMASRLHAIGDFKRAREHLVVARMDALESRDAEFVDYVDELLGSIAV